jgi:hypothetical protein
MTSARLQNAQAIAAIFAAVAVPVVVALAGWQIQVGISRDSVRKDYVQMSIGILANPSNVEDKPLRQWAIAVLDTNSPIPFSQGARAGLEQHVLVMQSHGFQALESTTMMSPPQPWVDPPKSYTLDQLIDNYAENMKRSQHNYLGLKYLQEAVRAGANMESESDTRDPEGAPPKPVP